MSCPTIVNNTVCVEANVKIHPNVEVGEVDTFYIGQPCFQQCRNRDNKCVTMVYQRMGVRFPLIYSANVTAQPTGISCRNQNTNNPSNECPQEPKESSQEVGDNRNQKNDFQELRQCYRGGLQQRRVRRNNFRCPIQMILFVLCGGRGFHL